MLTTALRISARALAEFMTSTPSAQRRIVLTNKYPSTDEAKAVIAYYRDARDVVERFFRASASPDYLEREICRLGREATCASPVRAARIIQNVRAIRDFKSGLLQAELLHVLPRLVVDLDVAEVILKVRPSLCLRDKGENTRWVFLDFSEGRLDDRKAGIVLQLFLQAARAEGIALKPKFAQYHHLNSRQMQHGVRHGSRLEVQIEASCRTFTDIWNSL